MSKKQTKMSKKQTKSAFDFYVFHFMEQERTHGQTFYEGRIATASDNWGKMTLQKREPFEKMAKNAKQKPVEKSKGIRLLQFTEKHHEEEANDMMKTTIKAIAENSSIDTVTKHEYYFIDGNYFFVSFADTYCPAELALIKFTFEDGVVDEFHTFIDPGKIQIGYNWEAREHSLKTHQLPLPPNAKGEKNFNLILQRIHKFLGNPSEIPPLFTLQENIPKIESFMKTFCMESNLDPNSYRVYPIHQLMFALKEKAIKRSIDDKPGFSSIFVAKEHLDHDKYLYVGKNACKFHDENDCSEFCSLSSVKRWSCTLMDHLCVDFNISLIAGKHFPAEINISDLNNTASRENKVKNTTNPIETQVSGSTMDSDFSTPERQMQSSSHTINHQSSSSDRCDFLSEDFDPSVRRNTYSPNTTLDHTPNATVGNCNQDLNSTSATDFSLLDAIRSNEYSDTRSLDQISFRGRGRDGVGRRRGGGVGGRGGGGVVRRGVGGVGGRGGVRGRGGVGGHELWIGSEGDKDLHTRDELNRISFSGAGQGNTINDKSFDLLQDSDINRSSISISVRGRGKLSFYNKVDVDDYGCCEPINPSNSRRGKGSARGTIVLRSEYIKIVN